MKFEFNLNWAWILYKIRILFIIGCFYLLYTYLDPVFAFMWALYFIYNDLTETSLDLDDLQNEKEQRLRIAKSSATHQRKNF